MTKFGDFKPLCHDVPSYPWCNLFYRQLLDRDDGTSVLKGLSADKSVAPVGIDPQCGIALVGKTLPGDDYQSITNVAQIVASGVSLLVVLSLIWGVTRRRAAVGRLEFRYFLFLYSLTLIFQVLSTGAVLEQGTTSIVVITAIHAGLVAALFWQLLGNALVATQVVEDGTLSSLIPFFFFSVAFFVATLYISLDTAFGFTTAFRSDPADALHNIGLFVLTSIWPGAAAIIYFILMIYIVLGVLREVRPVWFFVLSFALFVLSQLDFFLLNKVICKGADHRIDGAFVATILETASVVALFFGWRAITEESWEDEAYYRE